MRLPHIGATYSKNNWKITVNFIITKGKTFHFNDIFLDDISR